MGRRFALVAMFALALVPASGAADVLTSGQYVRNAIPAMEAYAADHGTYKGATVAKLRRAYDRSLGHIAIRTATRRTYCIESTTRPYAHKSGSAAPVSTGRCGTRGTPIQFTPPPSSTPPTTAEQRIRVAVPAMEAYAADHSGYAGMTLDAIRKYDYGIADITIVRATRETYCVESGSGSDERFKDGPGAAIAPGACPVSRAVVFKAPGEAPLKPNAEDMAFARKAQLRPTDFPAGTRRDPRRFANAFMLPRCAGYYEPDRTDLVATGTAEAFFRTPAAYYGSIVTVWRNYSEAETYWKRVLTSRYTTCLARNLVAWHPNGAATKLLYVKKVPARYSLGEKRAAYEIAIRYTIKGRSFKFVRAAFFFQNNRAIAVTMAGGVRNACSCTAQLAGRVYTRMRPGG